MIDTSLARELVRGLLLIAVLGLAAVAALIGFDVEAESVAVIVALVGPAIGALCTLATTRTGAQPEEQLAALVGRDVGRAEAVADVAALDQTPAPQAPNRSRER